MWGKSKWAFQRRQVAIGQVDKAEVIEFSKWVQQVQRNGYVSGELGIP